MLLLLLLLLLLLPPPPPPPPPLLLLLLLLAGIMPIAAKLQAATDGLHSLPCPSPVLSSSGQLCRDDGTPGLLVLLDESNSERSSCSYRYGVPVRISEIRGRACPCPCVPMQVRGSRPPAAPGPRIERSSGGSREGGKAEAVHLGRRAHVPTRLCVARVGQHMATTITTTTTTTVTVFSGSGQVSASST